MRLVLCNAGDDATVGAFQRLAPHAGGVELVTAEALAEAPRWEHRVGAAGAWTRITLADGRVLDSREVESTLDRMQFVPREHFRGAADGERQYAEAELHALFRSALKTFGVVQGPHPALRDGGGREPFPTVIPSVARDLGGRWRETGATQPPRSLATLGMTRSILLIGIPTERPLAMVGDALEREGADVVWFDQRAVDDLDIDGRVLRVGAREVPLDAIGGVYTRMMDDRLLPPCTRPQHSRRVHDALIAWCEAAPVRVINRIASMTSNGSKPYQSQLIREHGFDVPETLVTNDAGLVRDFAREYGAVIYKSVSGIRSIVRLLDGEAMQWIERIRWCPTQFQQFIEGLNVRVHVVGDEVFPTAARSEAVDYRYASRDGGEAALLEPFELDDETATRCVRLAAGLGLEFAGIDLKYAPDGRIFCFEVNPSPGFSYFEAATGQPIAHAVAKRLFGS
jgi:hypothetical protein